MSSKRKTSCGSMVESHNIGIDAPSILKGAEAAIPLEEGLLAWATNRTVTTESFLYIRNPLSKSQFTVQVRKIQRAALKIKNGKLQGLVSLPCIVYVSDLVGDKQSIEKGLGRVVMKCSNSRGQTIGRLIEVEAKAGANLIHSLYDGLLTDEENSILYVPESLVPGKVAKQWSYGPRQDSRVQYGKGTKDTTVYRVLCQGYVEAHMSKNERTRYMVLDGKSIAAVLRSLRVIRRDARMEKLQRLEGIKDVATGSQMYEGLKKIISDLDQLERTLSY